MYLLHCIQCMDGKYLHLPSIINNILKTNCKYFYKNSILYYIIITKNIIIKDEYYINVF